MAEASNPLDHVLAVDVAQEIRRGILTGRFLPGTRVKERSLAIELGVSRTPVREAMRLLANEGLISLRQGRSPIVKGMSVREALDETAVLLALEDLAVTWACRKARVPDTARLDRTHKAIAGQFTRLDPVSLFELDMQFHLSIAEAAGNASLFGTYKTYLERLWRVRFLSARNEANRDRVVSQHQAILDAISARDEGAALAAVRAHLRTMPEDIAAVLENTSVHVES